MSKSTIDNYFDVIVIGVGSMGSSACYFLTKRGYKVLGIEQFEITHEKGSHAGQSRIIRKAYFEHPDYVPLLNKAYQNWKDFEEETGQQVYYKTGLVYFGKKDNPVLKGIRQAASLYNIKLEEHDALSTEKNFPQFQIPTGFETLYEPDAGFITPEKAIRLYTEQANKKGATINTNEKVIEWKKEGNDILVKTDKQTYRSGKLIITAGAWAGKLIPGLADKLKITRQFIGWIKPKDKNDFVLNNFPCWMLADDERPGMYYGFPSLPVSEFGMAEGMKLAHHYPGVIVDPDEVNRNTTIGEEENLLYALNKYLPGCFESFLSSKTCLYTNTPDEDFIIDHLPGYDNLVTIGCGFSGHGFKFVSVIGEILTDLAIDEETKQHIEFLRIKRFT